MEETEIDERFTHIHKDPRFRRVPKKERKVRIDSRFQPMFDNKKFKVRATVDKRGRPSATTTRENLRKFYELDEGDDDDDPNDDAPQKDVKHTLDQDASSSSSSVEEEEEEEEEEEISSSSDSEEEDSFSSTDEDKEQVPEEDLVDLSSKLHHNWNDVDHDAPEADEISSRLAVCNMNWDRIRAKDLFVLFHSFLPTGGSIKSVTICPSEFGLERMAEEEKLGPRELRTSVENSNENENKDGEEFDAESLRLYQLNRLKYYYAVVEFDSKETANSVYEECDGMEYESSSARLDLRFIPDDMTFDHALKDQCFRLPDAGTYKPAVFTTTALCQQKVELTWDETDVERLQMTMKKFTDEDLEEEGKYQGLIASSSDEDEGEESIDKKKDSEEEEEDSDTDDEKSKNKYRSLLESLDENEDDGERKEAFMEITWEPTLKSAAKDLVKKKKKKEKLTPWDEYRQKKKEKKKQKREEQKRERMEMKKQELGITGEDAGFDDPFFNDDPEEERAKKKKKKKGKKEEEETLTQEEIAEREKQKAALGLLMQDEDDGLNHFSLDKILETESLKKKKGKKKDDSKDAPPVDTFEMDLKDSRFEAVYNSRLYNIDPSAPEYKETKGMKALIDEKLRRRVKGELEVESTVPESLKRKAVNEEEEVEDSSFSLASQQSVSALVRSVKAKTELFQTMKKLKKRR